MMIKSLIQGIKAMFEPPPPPEKKLHTYDYDRVCRLLKYAQTLRELIPAETLQKIHESRFSYAKALREGVPDLDDTDFLYLTASLKGWDAPRMQEIRSMLVNRGYWKTFKEGRHYMTNGVIQIGVYGDPYGLSDKYLTGSRVDLTIGMVNPRKRASVQECLGNQPILDPTRVQKVLAWYN